MTIKNRSLELRFLFLFPKHFFTQAKDLFPHPLALLSPPLQRDRWSTCTLKPRAGTVLVPPANRRVEFNGSGAPSGMMAQPQPAQGCAVCGAPSDPLDETREPAKRVVCRGRRPLVTLGLSKVTRPSPKGGRNPVEGSALVSCMAKPCHPSVGWHFAEE